MKDKMFHRVYLSSSEKYEISVTVVSVGMLLLKIAILEKTSWRRLMKIREEFCILSFSEK